MVFAVMWYRCLWYLLALMRRHHHALSMMTRGKYCKEEVWIRSSWLCLAPLDQSTMSGKTQIFLPVSPTLSTTLHLSDSFSLPLSPWRFLSDSFFLHLHDSFYPPPPPWFSPSPSLPLSSASFSLLSQNPSFPVSSPPAQIPPLLRPPFHCLANFRVWHDNSGSSPGWQFAYMGIVDMMTKEKYFFICNGWLSISEGDGTVWLFWRRRAMCPYVLALNAVDLLTDWQDDPNSYQGWVDGLFSLVLVKDAERPDGLAHLVFRVRSAAEESIHSCTESHMLLDSALLYHDGEHPPL